MSEKVLVAMSGGVDSSAAAAMLIEQGYYVSGAIMKLWQDGQYFEGVNEDIVNARIVAEKLGIDFYVFDLSTEFEREVVAPFCKEYIEGKTPNPCVFCNKHLKFGAFFNKAMEMGFDYIATGHYAKVICDQKGRYNLHCKQGAKDQSYVLYNLNQDILSHLLLPVGGLEKDVIREYAKKAGLPTFDSPDSQEICFIPDKDYARFLESRGYTTPVGDFVNKSGDIMGKHKGIMHYTVGQRKGLGSFGSPKFVLSVNAENNQVVLGENDDLFTTTLICDKVNFLDGRILTEPLNAEIKIRYSAKAEKGVISPLNDGKYRVDFDTPVRAITPGQSAVFYHGDILLGGGKII